MSSWPRWPHRAGSWISRSALPSCRRCSSDRWVVTPTTRKTRRIPEPRRPKDWCLRDASPVRLAALREIRTRLRRPSFYVFTGLLVVAIIAAGILYSVLNDDSPPTYDVGDGRGDPRPCSNRLSTSRLAQADIVVNARVGGRCRRGAASARERRRRRARRRRR